MYNIFQYYTVNGILKKHLYDYSKSLPKATRKTMMLLSTFSEKGIDTFYCVKSSEDIIANLLNLKKDIIVVTIEEVLK